MLHSTGIDLLEAAQVAKSAIVAGRGRVKRASKCEAKGTATLFPERMVFPVCGKAGFGKVNTLRCIGMKHLFNTLMPKRSRSHETKQMATNEEDTCYTTGREEELRIAGRQRCHPFVNFRRKRVIPRFIFRIRWKMWLQVVFLIPDPGMVCTVIPDNIECVKPGGQCRRFQFPFLGNATPYLFIRIIIEIGNKAHFRQGNRHPEGWIIVAITIFVIKMVEKLYTTHDNTPLAITLDTHAVPFLQIITPMREVRCSSIGKRAFPFRMRIGESTTKGNLYTLNGIQNKQPQISVKAVQKPDPCQGCSRD